LVAQRGLPQGWTIRPQPPSAEGTLIEQMLIEQMLLVQNHELVSLRMMGQVSHLSCAPPIKETGEINPIFG
jgi:hypothetical protein